MAERWYTISLLPDLTLNKYASLEDSGVDGVIERHSAFLRQINRAGMVLGLSFHLFYLYLNPKDRAEDVPGRRLNILLLIRGREEAMRTVSALIKSSPLAEYFQFEPALGKNGQDSGVTLAELLENKGIPQPQFSTCSFLTKTETLLPAGIGESEDYYMLREWEMNEDGRLYNMCRMMEALNQTALYRVDIYPVERSSSLREALRKPMSILRKRQDSRGLGTVRDYDGKDVLDSYEDLIEKYDSSPHFVSNIMVFANTREDAASILDAAGAESLRKGKYSIFSFTFRFSPDSFLSTEVEPLSNPREKAVLRKGSHGLVICGESAAGINLNYLPTLFSLEEIAPFFRFPALYDGEVIQLPKETAPVVIDQEGALFLGKDRNGYDVNLPLNLLPKHAFISGVPGSGKTNTMHHITSSLWKDHGIPFLVLEPAKQEYRALLNDPAMKGLYLFSPNADMSFPLHINPFEMPRGTMVAEHIRRLFSVFEGSFPLFPPLPFLLDTAIEGVYRELGWIPEHVYTGEETEPDGSGKRPLPTMSMLYRRIEKEINETSYDAELRGNAESALKVRIGSLLKREMGDVFDVPRSTFPPEKWLEVPAIIELESMGTGPANFLTLLLCTLIREALKEDPRGDRRSYSSKKSSGGELQLFYGSRSATDALTEFRIEPSPIEQLLASAAQGTEKSIEIESTDSSALIELFPNQAFCYRSKDGKAERKGTFTYSGETLVLTNGHPDIRHMIFIEEAHNLIGPDSEEKTGEDADPKCAATAFLVKMLAEVRALKEGIVIADQLPTVMAQEVLKNTGLKIGLKITSADDRSLLGGTMAASPLQLEEMATFSIGEALIFYENLMRPFRMRVKEWWGELRVKSQKAAMTTPRNDSDLRTAIKENPCYSEENRLSIKIICTKYYRKLKALSSRIERVKNWYWTVDKLKDEIKLLSDYLLRVERGEVIISDEEKADRNKQLFDLQKWYSLVEGGRSKDDKTVELISNIVEWNHAIERLRKGRWQRFDAPETERAQIALLQSQLAETALTVYKDAIQATGTSKVFQDMEPDMKELSRLGQEYNHSIVAYIKENGYAALFD